MFTQNAVREEKIAISNMEQREDTQLPTKFQDHWLIFPEMCENWRAYGTNIGLNNAAEKQVNLVNNDVRSVKSTHME